MSTNYQNNQTLDQIVEHDCVCNFVDSSRNENGFKVRNIWNAGESSSKLHCNRGKITKFFLQCYQEGIHGTDSADSNRVLLTILTILCIIFFATGFYLCFVIMLCGFLCTDWLKIPPLAPPTAEVTNSLAR